MHQMEILLPLILQVAAALPPENLSEYSQWSIAAGVIGTFVVAVLNRTRWASDLKFGVFFVWCVLSATVTSYTKRELDFDAWFGSALIVFIAGQATYHTAKGAIKTIEAKTG
jgi:hypothetical protein